MTIRQQILSLYTVPKSMNQIRSIGVFMIVCSVICVLIAYERYSTAKETAKAVAERLDGVEFVSVGWPTTSIFAATLGVVLLIAGLKCLADSFRQPQ